MYTVWLYIKSIRYFSNLRNAMFLCLLILPLFFISYRSVTGYHFYTEGKVSGITLVAPPKPFSQDPFQDIKEVNARWIAIVPYAFSRLGEPLVRYSHRRQWWGETPEGISQTIEKAKNSGLKVMLKPQVYIPGGWVGEMDFEQEEDWLIWERSYEEYIMNLVCIAEEMQVDLFCIGTEYKFAAIKREDFWRELTSRIQTSFSGKLTYSANWDHFEDFPMWDALDYIGISAYFPISNHKQPSILNLQKKWKPVVKKLKNFAEKNEKQILFTEYGYLSVDGCAGETWMLEKEVKSLPINEEAQANAYYALLSTFNQESFWAGGFLWKWFPDMKGHEGYPERDYTPQEKLAEKIIRKWYEQF